MHRVYEDIYFEEQADRLVFGNARLRLEFGRGAGAWLALAAEGPAGNLLAPAAPPGPAADFRVGGDWLVRRHGARLIGWRTAVDARRRYAALELVLGVLARGGAAGAGAGGGAEGGAAAPGPPAPAAAGPEAYEYEFILSYRLAPGEARLDRAARLVRGAAACPAESGARRLEAFAFHVPGAAVGDPADCTVDVPGPWFPKTYVAPATPYADLAGRSLAFHGAPDGGFGVLAVANRRLGTALAAWMDTRGEAGYHPSLRGDGRRLTLAFENARAQWLAERMAVASDVQTTVVAAGGLAAALAAYRAMAEATMPLDARTPAWVREMVLLEAYPAYYRGGLRELGGRLPFYREVGFNTVYLMPHWLGGYSPIDLYRVDPAVGTEEDLRRLVREAHRLGMRVLFDMVIHGFNEKSPVVRERPDLFIRNEDGTIARHHAWKSMSTDWAAPAYQQYLADLAASDLARYDHDGYRVDAASYKGANWDPRSPQPAYRSGSASPLVIRRMLEAMRRAKPDAVVLNEVFGPVFYAVSNLSHDNQTEAPQHFLERMEAGQATAAQYKAHLASVFALLPRGANRVCFARNHDTSWFYHFNGYTPRFLALDAVHALSVIPEVFAGDPKHGPHPDDDPAVYGYYRRLFALRREFPELAKGDLLLGEVRADCPQVFTALRRLEGRTVLVLVSLSEKPEEVRATVAAEGTGGPAAQAGSDVALIDPISSQTVRAAVVGRDPLALAVALKPFQVLVGRL